MAPRGRPRKQNTRMAAALDAMRPYGYEDALIVDTVNELLDVYGEEHWHFIEDCSYSVLLERILDKEEQKKNELLRDEAMLGSSSGSLALPCAEAEALNVALPTNEVVDPASQTDGTSDASLVTDKSVMLTITGPFPPCGEGGGSQNINLDKSSEKRLTACPHSNESKQPADSFPVRRRRPYHGWISDGEDEPELVDVEPPPVSEELQKVLFGKVVWKIRKSRWDLRPEDM